MRRPWGPSHRGSCRHPPQRTPRRRGFDCSSADTRPPPRPSLPARSTAWQRLRRGGSQTLPTACRRLRAGADLKSALPGRLRSLAAWRLRAACACLGIGPFPGPACSDASSCDRAWPTPRSRRAPAQVSRCCATLPNIAQTGRTRTPFPGICALPPAGGTPWPSFTAWPFACACDPRATLPGNYRQSASPSIRAPVPRTRRPLDAMALMAWAIWLFFPVSPARRAGVGAWALGRP